MSDKRIPELSPEARAIIAEGTSNDGPSASDRERVRASVMAAIAGGAATTAVATTAEATTSAAAAGVSSATATTAAATATGTALATKLTIVVALAVGGGAGVYLAQSTTDKPAVTTTAPETSPLPPPTVQPTPTPQPVAIAEALPTTEEFEPAKAAPVTKRTQATTKAPPPSNPSSDALEQLEQEQALLDLAGQALRSGKPARALALLDESRALFPKARMAQERSATRLLAQCAIGRTETTESAVDKFRTRYPSSAYLARIERACSE